jgi:hypothetical protein
MCISNTPLWLSWIIILYVPVALIILNLILAKFASQFYKKRRVILIVTSIVIGFFWAIGQFQMEFLLKCL